MILPYRSAADLTPNQIQNLGPTHVFAYSELRHELPTDSRTRVPLDRYVKASFSIDETCDVRIQPFLLIDRTCRIVTFLAVYDPRAYDPGVMATTFRGRVAQDASGFSSK